MEMSVSLITREWNEIDVQRRPVYLLTSPSLRGSGLKLSCSVMELE